MSYVNPFSYEPSDEQVALLDAVNARKKMRVVAYAGTGKTTSLEFVGHNTQRCGRYVCFNADNAKEAQRRMPGNIECKTTHSLAFADMIKRYRKEKLTNRANARMILSMIHIAPMQVTQNLFLRDTAVAFLAAETVRRFCHGKAEAITPFHVPCDGKLASLTNKELEGPREAISDIATRMWARMCDPRDQMPLGFDGYLKVWAMARPQLAGGNGFVMLDEAQDTNGVIVELMRHQLSQLIVIGDPWQAIYQWRGAVDAMSILPFEREARLTTSWRFGDVIAEHANRPLRLLGETIPLKGNPQKQSIIGTATDPVNAFLYRTNSRLFVDLIDDVEQGRKPCIAGGTQEIESMLTAAEMLMARKPVEYPAVFFGFRDWDEVREASKHEEDGDLNRWVQVIDKHGVGALKDAIAVLPKREQDAEYVMTTGHRSKGREWDNVVLADDFLRGIKGPGDQAKSQDAAIAAKQTAEDHRAELRLYYVASTRGKVSCDIPLNLLAKIAKLEGEMAKPVAEVAA